MFIRSIAKMSLPVVLLLSITTSLAFAQAEDSEPALALNPDSEQLVWGPCPPFLPEGCASAKPCILFIAFESPLDAEPINAAVP